MKHKNLLALVFSTVMALGPLSLPSSLSASALDMVSFSVHDLRTGSGCGGCLMDDISIDEVTREILRAAWDKGFRGSEDDLYLQVYNKIAELVAFGGHQSVSVNIDVNGVAFDVRISGFADVYLEVQDRNGRVCRHTVVAPPNMETAIDAIINYLQMNNYQYNEQILRADLEEEFTQRLHCSPLLVTLNEGESHPQVQGPEAFLA